MKELGLWIIFAICVISASIWFATGTESSKIDMQCHKIVGMLFLVISTITGVILLWVS